MNAESPQKRPKTDVPQSELCLHWKVKKGDSYMRILMKRVVSGKMFWIEHLKASFRTTPMPREGLSRLPRPFEGIQKWFLKKLSTCLGSCSNDNLRRWLMIYVEVLLGSASDYAYHYSKLDLFKQLIDSDFANYYPQIKSEMYDTIHHTDRIRLYDFPWEKSLNDHKNLVTLLCARNKENDCPFHHSFLPLEIFKIIVTMSDLAFFFV